MGHEEVQLQPSVSESHEQALYQADHNGKQRIAGKTQQHSSAMQTEPQGNFLQQASAVDEHHRESGLQNQVPGEPKLQLGDHYLQQQAASEAVHWQRENQLQQQAAEAANLLRQEPTCMCLTCCCRLTNLWMIFSGFCLMIDVCREDQRRQAAIQLELEVKVYAVSALVTMQCSLSLNSRICNSTGKPVRRSRNKDYTFCDAFILTDGGQQHKGVLSFLAENSHYRC